MRSLLRSTEFLSGRSDLIFPGEIGHQSNARRPLRLAPRSKEHFERLLEHQDFSIAYWPDSLFDRDPASGSASRIHRHRNIAASGLGSISRQR